MPKKKKDNQWLLVGAAFLVGILVSAGFMTLGQNTAETRQGLIRLQDTNQELASEINDLKRVQNSELVQRTQNTEQTSESDFLVNANQGGWIPLEDLKKSQPDAIESLTLFVENYQELIKASPELASSEVVVSLTALEERNSASKVAQIIKIAQNDPEALKYLSLDLIHLKAIMPVLTANEVKIVLNNEGEVFLTQKALEDLAKIAR